MRKRVRRFIDNIGDDVLLLYIDHMTRWLARTRLVKGLPPLEAEHRHEVQEFWSQYGRLKSTAWHRFYSARNGIKSPKYIPEDIFYSKIEPYFNNLKFAGAYSDKALYATWFEGSKLPETLFKNVAGVFYDDQFRIIDRNQALQSMCGVEKVIVKATVESGGGKNISVAESDGVGFDLATASRALRGFEENYIVQKFLHQHPVLASLNPSSVNTVRMITLLLEGEVHVLSHHLRIGLGGSFYDHGGIVCGISEHGVLADTAYKYKVGTVVAEHPDGYSFAGVEIPSFERMKRDAVKQHSKFAHFKIISWDFAVDSDSDPVLIEFNLRWQGLNHHQLTRGPLFGDLTESVLEKVFC